MEERIENPFCHMLILSLLYGYPEKKLSRMHISQVHRELVLAVMIIMVPKKRWEMEFKRMISALMIGACCENDSEF